MRISAEHSTVYRYDFPVYLEPHIFRLRPRTSNVQRLFSFDMRIAPTPAGSTDCLDRDANLALNAWFDAPARDLRVASRFTVEMLRENPFDHVLSGDSLNLSLWYREPLCSALASYRNDASVAECVKQYATAAAAGAQWNTLSFLAALSRQIFETFRHVTRPYVPPWSSDLTLSVMEGPCRDLAILFCDACRVMSIGWRGYDPSRGLAVTNGHIAVAAGFDHDLASPVAGWCSGGAQSLMEASLNLQVDDAG